jgi:beta-mannanase
MPQDMTALNTFEQDAGKKVAIAMFWRDWAGTKSTLDTSWLQAIASHGSIPMITWSPSDWDTGTNYSLSSIAAGTYDGYLTTWAKQLAAYGNPVLIRTMHEMNGTWYTSWSGNPSGYIAAWRHIHDLFVQNGATNVQWVWSPNVWWTGSLTTDPTPYYPGDSYVDWLALDGYNKTSSSWMSFSQIFSYSYNHITAISPTKPLMIAETSSGEATSTQAAAGDSKAKWITDALTSTLPTMPKVKALVWFNEDKTAAEGCCDWRIESSSSAQAAFATAVAPSNVISSR